MPPPIAPRSSSAPRSKRPSRTRRRLLAVTSLGLAGLVAGLLSGCSTQTASTSSVAANSYAQASGNWQISSSAPAAARLSSLGGNLTFEGTEVTGTLHPLGKTGQCLPPSTSIPVSGSVGAGHLLTLTAPLAGGTLTISGNLATDGHSLSGAAYSVSGGNCGMAAALTASARDSGSSPVTAQQYQVVNGTYAGTLTTADGETFALTSSLTDTSQPDADGLYHVSGTAASPGNTCLPASLPATASTIAGGSISTTWTDTATGASITASGNTSSDGATITISSWTITSPCGADTGTGTLARH